MRQQLIGYLFNSLTPSERAQVEQRLANEPRLRAELSVLRQQLVPLDLDCGAVVDAPADLTARTLDYVFSIVDSEPAHDSLSPPQPLDAEIVAGRNYSRSRVKLSPVRETAAAPARLNLIDMVTAAGLLLAVTLLLIPAVGQSRFVARRDECQNNLRQLGVALSSYAARHQGVFPHVPTQGPLPVAGVYAHTLLQTGYLEDERVVLCPASPLADQRNEFRMPSLEELKQAAKAQLAKWRRTVGGSYGYTLGHVQNGSYQPTRDLKRQHFALMADTPLASAEGVQPPAYADNHGGFGQNVLFEDGRVEFLGTRMVEATHDDIFANDHGVLAAGMHPDDAVIAPSAAMPLVWSDNRCVGRPAENDEDRTEEASR